MMGKSFSFPESKEYNDGHTPDTGNFALCRFHSTHIALRELPQFFLLLTRVSVCDTVLPEIKAIEEKIFDEKRYSLETPLE